VTITAGLVAMVYAVVEAPGAGWADGQTLGLLAISAVLMALFVAIEARWAAPLAPLRLFRSRALVGGTWCCSRSACWRSGHERCIARDSP
jgi:hypothetical protein